MSFQKICASGKLGKDIPSLCIMLQIMIAVTLVAGLGYLFITTELL